MEVNVSMNNNNNGGGQGGHGGRLAEQCPRCYSRNTKFCYFNNYSLNQPRHYCRACKRHWTKGGACRVVPVGGNRHKNRRARVGLGPPARRPARVYSGGSTAWPTAVAGRSSNVVVSGGRITNFSDPVDARVSAYRRSISSNLSFLQELNNVVSNNVSLGFGNFPPLPPLSGGDVGGAWQEESLWMSSGNPSDHMFLWGLDGASGSGLCRHKNGLPALNDIDFINNNHWADLPEFSPPPPPSSG